MSASNKLMAVILRLIALSRNSDSVQQFRLPLALNTALYFCGRKLHTEGCRYVPVGEGVLDMAYGSMILFSSGELAA